MASVVKRGNRYYVVYKYKDNDGAQKQKWESYKTMPEAKARCKEVDYKCEIGTFVVPKCNTLNDLMKEYIALYGRNKWAMSTYAGNVATIDHYITPVIGSMKLSEITPRVLEKYYQRLLKMKQVGRDPSKKNNDSGKEEALITTSIIRDIHKLLHNCFNQAVKWELMERNPATLATVPKYTAKKREIWTAETLFHAIEVCEDERLKLALHLAFSCSLRIGELLGLTWDCVDISEEAIASGKASITVNKELQRVNRASFEAVENPEILCRFPSRSSQIKTMLVLKSPKTSSSYRKIFLPRTVAELLVDRKKEQEYIMEALGDEYQNYDLVMAGPTGLPTESSTLTDSFQRLIRDHDLPKVVFHSLRHSSITYKLRLNGGNIKAVQGDSGHAQASMVTEVYSHILDEDRQHNAELFEKAFYSGRSGSNESSEIKEEKKDTATSPEMDILMHLLENPETAGLLKQLVKALDK